MKRWMQLFLVSLLVLTLLAGCGAGSLTAASNSSASSAATDSADWEGDFESTAQNAYGTDAGAARTPDVPSAAQQSRERKLVYTANLTLETTDFDQAVADLAALTEQCGGYYESSSVDTWGSSYRHASYTVRIPSAQYRAFLEQAGKLCHQLSYSENADDITET